MQMDEEGGNIQHLKGPGPIKPAQSVTKDTFYEQLYCSAGSCPCENRRAQLMSHLLPDLRETFPSREKK